MLRTAVRAFLVVSVWMTGCATHHIEAPPVRDEARVSGKIVRIHPASNRIELADAGRRFSVFYSEETLIKSGTTELSATDIRPGDRIVVSLGDTGEAHARIITLAAPLRKPTPTPSKEMAVP